MPTHLLHDDSTNDGPNDSRVSPMTLAGGPVAVLCDLDGTLLNTEEAWQQSVIASIAARGLVASHEVISAIEGATLEQAAALLVERFGLIDAEEVLRELEARALAQLSDGTDWLPGARELLEALSGIGVPIGLVTSSPQRWVDQIAQELDLSVFQVVITADDVVHTKPHPEPYQMAAAAFGIEPAQCIVFEDSRPGLSSAVAAGCRTVLVRADRVSWAGSADALAPSLLLVTSDWLAERFGPWSARVRVGEEIPRSLDVHARSV